MAESCKNCAHQIVCRIKPDEPYNPKEINFDDLAFYNPKLSKIESYEAIEAIQQEFDEKIKKETEVLAKINEEFYKVVARMCCDYREWQDEDRTMLEVERVYETRYDCTIMLGRA